MTLACGGSVQLSKKKTGLHKTKQNKKKHSEIVRTYFKRQKPTCFMVWAVVVSHGAKSLLVSTRSLFDAELVKKHIRGFFKSFLAYSNSIDFAMWAIFESGVSRI